MGVGPFALVRAVNQFGVTGRNVGLSARTRSGAVKFVGSRRVSHADRIRSKKYPELSDEPVSDVDTEIVG